MRWRVGLAFTTLIVVACVAGCRGSTSGSSRFAPAAVDTGSVVVNGTHLFYEATGRGPAVVLLHSGDLDRRQWDPQFLSFAREHRIVRFDARGYGHSGPANSPFRADEDLYAFLVALHLPRASLVGSSLGGRIAIDFALAHPSMVDRLVLAAPGLSGWQFTRGDTSWLPEARAARDRGDWGGIAVAWLKQDVMRAAMERPELAAHLREVARDNGPFWKDVVSQGGEKDEQGSPPALDRIKLVTAPTLLIVGTRDTRDIEGIADTLNASMPNVRRVTFQGAGHMLNLEQADRFNTLVLDFLRR